MVFSKKKFLETHISNSPCIPYSVISWDCVLSWGKGESFFFEVFLFFKIKVMQILFGAFFLLQKLPKLFPRFCLLCHLSKVT